MNERLTTDDLRGMLPSEIVERFDDLRAKLAASEASLAAMGEALQRLVDVDMGLRDQIARYLPDGVGLWLRVRGILVVQDAKNVLAEQPAAPASGTEVQ